MSSPNINNVVLLGASVVYTSIFVILIDSRIVDESKRVPVLGSFPLPVEVIPMARSFVARELVKLGGDPEYRQGVVTDNGNVILDVHNLEILNPRELEQKINNIPGVVTNGIFALRGADIVLSATDSGVETFK